jgi:hypothetical protein
VCAFWECGGYVTSHKNGEQTPSQKAKSDCGDCGENDRRQPASRQERGRLAPTSGSAGGAVCSLVRNEREGGGGVVASEHRIWTP